MKKIDNDIINMVDEIEDLFHNHRVLLIDKDKMDRSLQGQIIKAVVKNHKIRYILENDPEMKKEVFNNLSLRIGVAAVSKICANLDIDL